MYHTDLSGCVSRFRHSKDRIVLTPDVFWFSFAAETAARIGASEALSKELRQERPIDIGMTPHPGGAMWPSDEMVSDQALYPAGIPMVLNAYQQFVFPEGLPEGTLSHHAISASVAAHMGLTPKFGLSGQAPFWMPNIRSVGFGMGSAPGPYPAVEPASGKDAWTGMERAVREVAGIGAGLGKDGSELSAWAGEVADLARDVGDACQATEGAGGDDAVGGISERLQSLFETSTDSSQAAVCRFRHHDRDMSIHYGVFWSVKEPSGDAARPELGWVLSLC